ncbi:MAG: hypothetical protein ABS75_33350 [Pelagibacterium sp. SCN 63-23]|nr:MAG: hypothetical protein ABS75_33350 [Pelagibacterium sp. SCN 63-23]
MPVVSRLLLLVAGLVGGAGVAAAAAASHADTRNLGAIAAIFLAHGPALLALGLFARSRPLMGAGVILALGTLVFGGDLALREFFGQGAFPGAAPTGGGAMMLGWLGIALGGMFFRD